MTITIPPLRLEYGRTENGHRRHIVNANMTEWARAVDNLLGPWCYSTRRRIPAVRCRSQGRAVWAVREDVKLCCVCLALRDDIDNMVHFARIEWAENELRPTYEAMIEERVRDAPF